MSLNAVDFDDLQMKPLLYNLITQTILPLNESTINISKGDKLDISFNNTLFKDYKLLVTNVSHTSLSRIKNEDISKNGFIYKIAFLTFMKESRNIQEEDSIVKLDFKIVER